MGGRCRVPNPGERILTEPYRGMMEPLAELLQNQVHH